MEHLLFGPVKQFYCFDSLSKPPAAPLKKEFTRLPPPLSSALPDRTYNNVSAKGVRSHHEDAFARPCVRAYVLDRVILLQGWEGGTMATGSQILRVH